MLVNLKANRACTGAKVWMLLNLKANRACTGAKVWMLLNLKANRACTACTTHISLAMQPWSLNILLRACLSRIRPPPLPILARRRREDEHHHHVHPTVEVDQFLDLHFLPVGFPFDSPLGELLLTSREIFSHSPVLSSGCPQS
jgi:hypothetical protein